jgi:hypothetical protein
MAFTIEFLSASNSGEPIQVAAITSPGTIIHSGIAGTTQKDEVFIYAHNTGTGVFPMILEIGSTGAGNRVSISIAPQDSYQLIYPGIPINNSAIIRGYCTSGANVILAGGYVQRGP